MNAATTPGSPSGSAAVSRSIEVMVREHALLHRVLRLFARYAAHVRGSADFDPGVASAFLRFFRDFGEVHRRREECDLFPWLRQMGVRDAGGPLGILRAEHGETRELLTTMAALIDALGGEGALPESRECFCVFVERFAGLLSEHEWKENHIVYPLAEYLGWSPSERSEAVAASEPHADEAELRGWLTEVEALAAGWPEPRIELHPEPLGFELPPSPDPASTPAHFQTEDVR